MTEPAPIRISSSVMLPARREDIELRTADGLRMSPRLGGKKSVRLYGVIVPQTQRDGVAHGKTAEWHSDKTEDPGKNKRRGRLRVGRKNTRRRNRRDA